MNGLLLRSIEEKTPLDMIYLSSKNQITQRRIIVKEIKGSTFSAYCFLRKQTRLFKIENILSIMPMREHRSKIG